MDGVLTSEEVNNMHSNLPKGSLAEQECSKLVREFTMSIFKRKLVEIQFIDFEMFSSKIPLSCFVEEFRTALLFGRTQAKSIFVCG